MTTELPSTRPYLIRALHQWCMDHGFTPYLAVSVDGSVRVPRQHVVNGEIVLNVSTDATGSLALGDEFIEFKARFGGVSQSVVVPVGRVSAIYARENGQGMAFPIEPSILGDLAVEPDASVDELPPFSLVDGLSGSEWNGTPSVPGDKPRGGPRPALKRIK